MAKCKVPSMAERPASAHQADQLQGNLCQARVRPLRRGDCCHTVATIEKWSKHADRPGRDRLTGDVARNL